MRFPRLIPTLVFQVIASVLLTTCLALTVYWIAADAGLYRQLDEMLGERSQALAMLLTFLVMFLSWLAVTVPMRKLSQLPTIKEELGAGIEDGLPKVMTAAENLYQAEKTKNEEMYRAQEYTKEMRQRARRIGVGFSILGTILTLAGVWMLVVATETGYMPRVALVPLILGPAFMIAGLVQVATGRSVLRK